MKNEKLRVGVYYIAKPLKYCPVCNNDKKMQTGVDGSKLGTEWVLSATLKSGKHSLEMINNKTKKHKTVGVTVLYCWQCGSSFLTEALIKQAKKNNPGYAILFTARLDNQLTSKTNKLVKQNNTGLPACVADPIYYVEPGTLHQAETNEVHWKRKKLQSDDYITVFKTICHCRQCEMYGKRMNSEACALVVKDCHLKDVPINIFRCTNCGRYFIEEDSLRLYENRYGILLFERNYEGEADRFDETVFNSDSVLSRCGYRAQRDDSDQQRHAVIKFILETERATKDEIVELLTFFVKMKGDRCPYAKPKWENDIQFTNDYRIEKQATKYGLKFVSSEQARFK